MDIFSLKKKGKNKKENIVGESQISTNNKLIKGKQKKKKPTPYGNPSQNSRKLQ